MAEEWLYNCPQPSGIGVRIAQERRRDQTEWVSPNAGIRISLGSFNPSLSPQDVVAEHLRFIFHPDKVKSFMKAETKTIVDGVPSAYESVVEKSEVVHATAIKEQQGFSSKGGLDESRPQYLVDSDTPSRSSFLCMTSRQIFTA
ncbi:MAG TPA: hypothetical protein DCP92_21350 [Nitrospiraceae bacterium]|jgi:hypothetical protein|nr:hypothetical protein [Nitrospiraceae bacterium]